MKHHEERERAKRAARRTGIDPLMSTDPERLRRWIDSTNRRLQADGVRPHERRSLKTSLRQLHEQLGAVLDAMEGPPRE